MTIRAADEQLSVRVGGVMILVLIAGFAYFLVLRDRLFLKPSVRIRVYFAQVGALHEGAPVIVAGRAVGKVESIHLHPAGSADDGDPLHGEAGAVALVRIDKARRGMVPVNGDFFIAAKGIFSDRYLEVGPPRGGAAPDRPVQSGDEVRGADPPSMDRVLQNTWNNLTTARLFLAEVEPPAHALVAALEELSGTLATLEPVPGELDGLRAHVDDVATEARTTMLALEAGGLQPDAVAALAGRARAALSAGGVSLAMLRLRIARLSTALDGARGRLDAAAPGLERKLRAALVAADRAVARLDTVRADVAGVMDLIARGEGTLGKLANDPEFPEDAKELGKILKRTPWRVVGHPQDDLDQ